MEINDCIIKITRSQTGKTGTVCFIFFHTFNNFFKNYTGLNGFSFNCKEKNILTFDTDIIFKKGQPNYIRVIIFFNNSDEWFKFMKRLNYYSKKNKLLFSETLVN